MNSYLNRRNERARWRRYVRSLRRVSRGTARSMIAELLMMGALDKRNGGFGVPDNVAAKKRNRKQRRRSAWVKRGMQ